MRRTCFFAVACLLSVASLVSACSDEPNADGEPLYCDSQLDCPDDYRCQGDEELERMRCVWNPPTNNCASASGCADGGADAGDTGDAAPPGRLQAPQAVSMPSANVGDSVAQTVELANAGQGTLTISSIELFEESGGEFDGIREFYRGDAGWDGSHTLSPGQTVSVEVEYRPENAVTDEASIVVRSDDPDQPIYEIALHVVPNRPQLTLDTTVVNFGQVPPSNTPSYQLLTAHNTGGAPLQIDDIYVSGSDRFSVSYPDPDSPGPQNDSATWPAVLAPAESFEIRVGFLPEDNLPESGELVITSNDAAGTPKVVELHGNTGAACMSLNNADGLDFSQATVDQTTYDVLTIENCSRSTPLELSEISITNTAGDAFGIDQASLPSGLPSSPATVAPGERVNVVLTFTPTAQATYEAELLVRSNDPTAETTRTTIEGRGSDNACPHAVADAWIEGQTPGSGGSSIVTSPQETIQFDGQSSSDSDGSVRLHQWSLLDRPFGSTTRLIPTGTSTSPRLLLDVIGVYEVELVVVDDEGTSSCGNRALVTIDARADADVVVQLVWDTPADSDPRDEFGADMDLHYRHENGDWNQAPWGIFWQNRNPDWGTSGDDTDDPSLALEDDDGAGPEFVYHNGLESSVDYGIGAYYYSAETLGASYATIQVYVDGQLEFEHRNKHVPTTGSFWHAARLTGPTGPVQSIDQTHQGFP